MLQTIKKFIANRRRQSFERRIQQEIFHQIFPHLRQEANHGYPFATDEDIDEEGIRGFLRASSLLREFEQAANKMPKSYGEGLRYIAYRDLNEQLKRYTELAKENEYAPTPEDYQLAARSAC